MIKTTNLTLLLLLVVSIKCSSISIPLQSQLGRDADPASFQSFAILSLNVSVSDVHSVWISSNEEAIKRTEVRLYDDGEPSWRCFFDGLPFADSLSDVDLHNQAITDVMDIYRSEYRKLDAKKDRTAEDEKKRRDLGDTFRRLDAERHAYFGGMSTTYKMRINRFCELIKTSSAEFKAEAGDGKLRLRSDEIALRTGEYPTYKVVLEHRL